MATPETQIQQPSEAPPQTFLTGKEVTEALERSKIEDEIRRVKLQEASRKADEEAEHLQRAIYDVANPSPIKLTILIILILVIIYVLYVVFIKPNLSGCWVDDSGQKFFLEQGYFSNKFDVYSRANDYKSWVADGTVRDNYIKFSTLIGIWNYGSEVAFLGGTSWYKLY